MNLKSSAPLFFKILQPPPHNPRYFILHFSWVPYNEFLSEETKQVLPHVMYSCSVFIWIFTNQAHPKHSSLTTPIISISRFTTNQALPSRQIQSTKTSAFILQIKRSFYYLTAPLQQLTSPSSFLPNPFIYTLPT